ncbi:hypothetical protein ACJX0J_039607, partial [Zea mays]
VEGCIAEAFLLKEAQVLNVCIAIYVLEYGRDGAIFHVVILTVYYLHILSIQYGITEVKERLHTPCTTGYQFEDEHANGVYQEEELPTTFTIDEGVALNSLLWIEEDSLIMILMNFDVGFLMWLAG